MCGHCDLSTLSPRHFDSFFDSALAEGAATMVCRHCGTSFSTDILLLAGNRRQSPGIPAVAPA